MSALLAECLYIDMLCALFSYHGPVVAYRHHTKKIDWHSPLAGFKEITAQPMAPSLLYALLLAVWPQ